MWEPNATASREPKAKQSYLLSASVKSQSDLSRLVQSICLKEKRSYSGVVFFESAMVETPTGNHSCQAVSCTCLCWPCANKAVRMWARQRWNFCVEAVVEAGTKANSPMEINKKKMPTC